MSVSGDLRDKRALVLRLIVAEALAKPGEGPLAPRFAALTLRERLKRQAQLAVEEPKEPAR